MKWNNVQKDKLPPAKKQVLICVNGINYISEFCPEQRLFKSIKPKDDLTFKPDDHVIYWRELDHSNNDISFNQ